MRLDFFGIARERVYSPGKVDDDRAIIDAVAAQLAGAYRVAVCSGDDPLPDQPPAPVVFAMCQGPAALEALRRWESAGVRVINSTTAIANTHRARMLAAFERHRIPHPPSRLVNTGDTVALPEWIDAGAWLKRGDVHATEPEDVVRVDGRGAARAALSAMQRRGITTALAQRHVEGDVFKFYAVRESFFACFPPSDVSPPLDEAGRRAMRDLAEAGARALELEVFGGDCVRDRANSLWLIDLNDWPSYARCRFAAGQAIAAYLKAHSAGTGPSSKTSA